MQTKAVVWFLYIIRTARQTLYTGITTDVARRLHQHQIGKGAKHLKGHQDLIIVYQLSVGDRSTALKLEYRIKQLTKIQKEKLVLSAPNLSALYTFLNMKTS
jgi:putative endonuclease